MNLDIAVVILNYIQYVNIIPGINALVKRGYKVDIYCPKITTNDGFDDMYNDNIKLLKKNGYNVYSKTNKKKYKILLEPYPYLNILSQYRIRYRYSNISAKPNIVYKPENYLWYDAILCSGKYESNLLSVFSKTFNTGNMLFQEFKKSKKRTNGKKNLIYLPTYGSESSIELVYESLELLKDHYNIITKIHHGTTFLKDEKNRILKLKKVSDEFYDCKKDLCELLSIADVVLTDNSGAIFDCLYAKVPVASFCDNINKNKLINFDTTQFSLFKKGILPYSNKISDLRNLLSEAQNDKIIKLQNQWATENFHYSKDAINEFVNVIKKFLEDNIDFDYIKMHEILREEYIYNLNERKRACELDDKNNSLMQKNEQLELELKSKNTNIEDLMGENSLLQKINNDYKSELDVYRKGKLYKIATKIYSFKGKLLCKKK